MYQRLSNRGLVYTKNRQATTAENSLYSKIKKERDETQRNITIEKLL